MADKKDQTIEGVFEQMEKYGHEQVIFNYDKATGLKAIVAIHDTTLGPALGGCRMWNYETEQTALNDALRLSRGMTYKCAVAGVPNGGGKTVIIGDPRKDKSDELFQALGTYIETLKGRFYTGTDVGTVGMDFVSAAKQSKYLVGLPEEYGGSGNSAIITAFGVWRGVKATAYEAFGSDSMKNLTIAVQGLGKVGYNLLGRLHEEGAKLIVADVDEESVHRVKKEYPDVIVVSSDEIYGVECDIFSPNALGAILNDQTIPQLKCKAICGAANNQLAEPRHGDALQEMGILYAPDYIANAGGLIQVADELKGYNKERAFNNASLIYDILLQVYATSKQENLPTYKAADRMIESRIETIGRIKRKYTN